MEEIKIRCTSRVKNRIIMLAKERGLSMNKMGIYLLEIGIYKLLEEESKYGEKNYLVKRKKDDK